MGQIMSAKWSISGRFPSVANVREHWSARARRAKAHRAAVMVGHLAAGRPLDRIVSAAHRYVVILTRHGRRLDSDNLAASMKSVRDGVAGLLGVDDGSPRVAWVYRQAQGVDQVDIQVEAIRG